MRELALLNTLRNGIFHRSFYGDARFLLLADGDRIEWSPTGVVPDADRTVDAVITCESGDLDRMLQRQAPEGGVNVELGNRDVAPRLKQARVVLACSALGWMGPLPNPNAPLELERMVRRAAIDLMVGPTDQLLPLFSQRAPAELHHCRVRFTDGARRQYTSEGLADTPLEAEISTFLGVEVLRRSAAAMTEAGRVLPTLQSDDAVYVSRVSPLPSARGKRVLVRVERARA